MIALGTAGGPDSAVEVSLLGGFRCCVRGEPVRLPLGAQRVLAFLALRDRPVQRSYVAANLWLDRDEGRAAANLRSAMWRLGRMPERAVTAESGALALHPLVKSDVRTMTQQTYRLADTGASGELPSSALFERDLLPDWYDEWLVLERERIRQLRLQSLDLLSGALAAAGHFTLAIDAACSSIAGEPLRESAHRALVRAHLAAGNPAEAIRQYESFRVLLYDAVGLTPTDDMHALVADLLRLQPSGRRAPAPARGGA